MTISVIIVTLNRPDYVRRCLGCLHRQSPLPDQIIVVDASPDDKTRHVVAESPEVLYLRNENGFGRMTASRNIGLRHASGDIIAFLDDDAFAHDGWLSALLGTYSAPDIGAVGGRALNNQPGEEKIGVDRIGQLGRNGMLYGFFAADPTQIIEVDHIIGCNMSFRREVLAKLGGFREDFPGMSGFREDSDMCLRVGRIGHRILFNPKACVDHVGAPLPVGHRFDRRYSYFAAHNHMVLLIRNFGLLSSILWRYLFWICSHTITEGVRKIALAVLMMLINMAGTLMGAISGLMSLMKTGRQPVRLDAGGHSVTTALSAPQETAQLATAQS